MKIPESAAGEKGFMARLRGEEVDTCPYTAAKSAAQWRQGWELAASTSRPPAPKEPRDPVAADKARLQGRTKDVAEIVVAVAAVVGCVLGLLNFSEGRLNATTSRRIEATRLLDQAWDLLGGRPGTETITVNFYGGKRGPATSRQPSPSEKELARRLISEALEVAPDFPLAHRRQGHFYQAQGKHEEAEACFREAVRLDPDNAAAHNNLGVALAAQEKYEEAEASYRQSLAIRPDNASAHNNLGTALFLQDKPVEAEASFREAVRLDSDDFRSNNNLGAALRAQRKEKEAEEVLRQAVKLGPYYAPAHANLGVVLLAQGRFEEAGASFCKAVELDPDDDEALEGLGEVRRALEIDPCPAESRDPSPGADELSEKLPDP